jgi:hypothetical protein
MRRWEIVLFDSTYLWTCVAKNHPPKEYISLDLDGVISYSIESPQPLTDSNNVSIGTVLLTCIMTEVLM